MVRNSSQYIQYIQTYIQDTQHRQYVQGIQSVPCKSNIAHRSGAVSLQELAALNHGEEQLAIHTIHTIHTNIQDTQHRQYVQGIQSVPNIAHRSGAVSLQELAALHHGEEQLIELLRVLLNVLV
jgi:hypothetical protein